jgi:hypothetical protein
MDIDIIIIMILPISNQKILLGRNIYYENCRIILNLGVPYQQIVALKSPLFLSHKTPVPK